MGLLLFSCGKPIMFDHNEDVPIPWNQQQSLAFDFPVHDTLSPFNFYINIRNTVDYNFSNIFFFVRTQFPNGQYSLDTVEVFLADVNGNWLGKGMGKNKDNQILFRKRGRFPMAGNYTISFIHAMRVEDLEGIKSLGIRIEKTE
jgi:gliding motility-associated lipoprotein GldH